MYNRPIEGFNRRMNPINVRASLEDGTALGVISLKEAFRIADESGVDVVGLNPTSSPPIVKIMDYGRFKYLQKQREKETKKKQIVVETKEIKIRTKIDQHDLDIKTNQMISFLQDGDKVKVTLQFRGREIVHPEIGKEIISKILDAVKASGVPDSRPMMEGKVISVLIVPLKKVQNVNSVRSNQSVERGPEGQQSKQEHSKSDPS